MAISAHAPARAATGTTCYPVTWTTSGSTSTGTQLINVTAADGKTSTVEATTAITGSYRLPGGTAYTPLNMTSTAGGVMMSTYVVPTSGANGDASQYQSIFLKFPDDATGPISFSIKDIDSAVSADRVAPGGTNKSQYYTDSVQVLNDDAVVAPAPEDLSGAVSQDGSWVTATQDGTRGSASYTIQDPGTVEIRLRNAYTGTIDGQAHPNQTVLISNMVCGDTPPEPTCAPAPYSRTRVQRKFKDYVGNEYLDVSLALQVNSLPPGVTVESIEWEVWFRGATNASEPGKDVPIWNSDTSYWSGGVAISDRSGQSATNLPWTPGIAGFSNVATSDTTSLTSHTFLDGTTADAWNLKFSWTGDDGANGTYTTDTNGCEKFDTGESGKFRINYSSARSVTSMGTGYCAWTTYLEDMFYTATLSNGCVLTGTFRATLLPQDPGNCDPDADLERIAHNVTQTC